MKWSKWNEIFTDKTVCYFGEFLIYFFHEKMFGFTLILLVFFIEIDLFLEQDKFKHNQITQFLKIEQFRWICVIQNY